MSQQGPVCLGATDRGELAQLSQLASKQQPFGQPGSGKYVAMIPLLDLGAQLWGFEGRKRELQMAQQLLYALPICGGIPLVCRRVDLAAVVQVVAKVGRRSSSGTRGGAAEGGTTPALLCSKNCKLGGLLPCKGQHDA